MGYSKEVVGRARRRLETMRNDRESQIRARLQEAYAQLPRLKQIDMELRRTMAAAAQAVFAQGGDVQAAMDQVRRENQLLQQQRQELVAKSFPAGYLDETPVCDRCGGTGYIGTAMCRCLEELCADEQIQELGKSFAGGEHFDGFRLDYYSEAVDPRFKVSPRELMRRNLDNCKRYCAAFGENAGNLLFIGGTGLGKTYLAACIARAVTAKGYSVVYESAISLFNKLERAKFSPTEENRREAEKMESCDLLIIDDLGTEMPGQFVTAALYGLLNQRLLAGRPMVITTNLNVEEAGKRYSNQIASRLYGEFSRLTFIGSDIRVLKNRGL